MSNQKQVKSKKISALSIVIFVIIAVISYFNPEILQVAPTEASQQTGNLLVHFIDVGQADAILITKGSEAMLIDGGNRDDAELVIQYLIEQDVKKLKYVIATHPHEDHIGGLSQVLTTFEVEKVILSNGEANTETFGNLIDSIENNKVPSVYANVGDIYTLGDASFKILAPNSEYYEELNNYSVVVKLVNGNNSFMFMGDAEQLSESEILERNATNLTADVLKVGHHGSKSSTSQKFLDAVHPQYAVISVGKDNDYGLPKQQTINRLNKIGVTTYRTDEHGTIIMKSDGNTISVKTEK